MLLEYREQSTTVVRNASQRANKRLIKVIRLLGFKVMRYKVIKLCHIGLPIELGHTRYPYNSNMMKDN